ncbi:MAG TPA: sigma-70 family RNA polymerase sigma factor [Gemmataceae bacterium]|jgi:RNA polymerase sigma-70 factor (ECF subfamily)|nr:sigma-70 family RNA polymerase sigma factor [Gemmataceae bacterium]
MSQPPIDTTAITPLIRRVREGDRAAENELAQAILARFEALARRMLHKFPGVRRYEDTADLVQEAMIRLLRSLREVSPTNTREFFGLAAEQIRRQLLDLLKRHRQTLNRRREAAAEPASPAADDADLTRWAAFHEAVSRLPVEEREVFMLSYYHNWTQAEMAELFQVNERTVRRRWEAANASMREFLTDDPT